RQIYAAESPLWDRRWRLIMVVGELPARQREQLRRALFWQGFGDLAPGCFVHPGADLNTAFDALVTDGMAEWVPQLISLVAANPRVGLSATDDDIVRRAWNLDRLAADYAAFALQYQPMLDELRSASPEHIDAQEAFLARTLLIHDYRRLLLRDPELPEVLLPTAWPGHAARALCKEIYRRLLSASEQFLDQHLHLANGTIPPASALLQQRFQGRDVLAGV
ncbi:MAG: phenylacetic acid degradation operon negative regulatory protein PaaX, partial [Pseudomonadota bacterium]